MRDLNIIISTILLYCLNKLFQYLSFDYLFLTNFMYGYFNDILAGSLLIAFTNWLLKEKSIKQLWKIECFILLVGCFWEFITPLYNPNSIGDIYDLLAYLIGGFIYWLIRNDKFKNLIK